MFVDEVRYDESGTAFFQRVREVAEHIGYIRAAVVRLEVNKLTDNKQYVATSFLGRNELFNLVREKYHTNLIIILDG